LRAVFGSEFQIAGAVLTGFPFSSTYTVEETFGGKGAEFDIYN